MSLIKEQVGPKYLRVADAIERGVKEHLLHGGDRLPPQRELADALGVTLGTVSRGYAEAEKRGLLQGETGRGTFIRTSEPDRFSLHSLHNMPDRDSMVVIQFDLNFPVQKGSPDLGEMLARLSTRSDLHELLDYRPTFGLIRHRQKAAAWLKQFGISAQPERIAITGGVQHGLQTVLSSQMDSGEALAVEQYTYPGMLNLARHLGIRLVPIPMDHEGMRPDALRSIARQHKLRGVYLMPTLQNPTTATMPEDRRLEIARLVRELDIFLIEDDVYAVLEEKSLTPISTHIPERSFYLTGLSKALAPGLRVGFLVIPDDKLTEVEAAMAASIWHTPPLMAEISSQWIEDGTGTRVATAKRREATRRARLIKAHLPDCDLVLRPGSLHLWLRLPEPWRGEDFARQAEEKGVLVIPSVNFFPGPHPEQQAIRICVGPPKSDEELIHGAELLTGLLNKTKKPDPGMMII
ncbi:MAG: PLP-dependent aminotransferase family protein [Thermodesulfobacteriota bacterium]